MRKKYCLLVLLAFVSMLGTIATYLPPPVKAQEDVRFYVDPLIYAGLPPPPPFPPPQPNLEVKVMIESPYTWMGTADGITSFMVSVRVDPRALKVADIVPGAYGEDFMDMYAVYLQYLGYDVSTAQGPPAKDVASGTMSGYANGLTGPDWDPVLGGAGGDAFYADDVAVLCVIKFITVSATQPSVIDLMGPGISTEQIVKGIEVSCKYKNAQGDTVVVEPEDGYYVAETPDIMFVDLNQTASVIGSLWHELQPEHCQEWEINDHTDTDGDGALDESEQIGMTRSDGYSAMYHVEWVNPTPEPGDGIADLIVKWKEEVPEFPLGIGITMMIALVIPIVYLWRTRKKEK